MSLLVRFDAVLDEESRHAVVSDHGARLEEAVGRTGFYLVSAGGRRTAAVQRELGADPRVASVEHNHVRAAFAVPNDLYYASGQASYLDPIRLPAAWDVTTGADDLVLAVIDSGVDLQHPDLDERLIPGRDFVNDDDSPEDDFGHGTQVATIAAASTDNRTGIAGVAWRARVLPVKVLDNQGRGTDADIAAGITWAVDHGADVINLSFGGPQPSQTLAAAVEYAHSRNVIIVSAAGNAHASSPDFPAALDGVIAVSATDRNGNLAWFSNYGPSIDVAAPGVDVLAGTFDGPYQRMEGTSFAAPIVAGVALLARSRFPGDSADGIIDRIRRGARDAGPLGIDDYFGSGIVDALAAVGGPPPDPRIIAAADALEPDNTPDRASLLTQTASAGLSPEGDVDWFATDVASPRWLNFSVVPPTAGGSRRMDAVLEVFGPAFNLIERIDAAGPGGREETNLQVGGGRHYLRVSNLFPSASPGSYQVSVSPGVASPQPFVLSSIEGKSLPSAGSSVAIGDLTGDGANDILVSTAGPGSGTGDHQLFLFPQIGGGLGPPLAMATGGTGAGHDMGLALGDLDGDGDLDAAVATTSGIELRYQQTGGLSAPALVPLAGAHQVRIGDVDGDGRRDLVVASVESGIQLLRNRGGGRFDPSSLTFDHAAEIEMSDVNDDGRSDVIAFECPNGCQTVAVYTSQTDGGFSRSATVVAGGTAADRCALGVGHPGGRRREILASCSNRTDTHILEQQDDGTFRLNGTWGTTGDDHPHAIELADVDGVDGDDWIVLYGNGKLHLPSWGGGINAVSRADDFGPQGLAVGDVDGDGRPDLAAVGPNMGLAVLRQGGPLGGSDGERVWVRDTTPADGSSGAAAAVAPTLRFARPLDPASVTPATVTLTDGSTGAAVPAGVTYDPALNTAVLHPHEPLTVGRPYLMRAAGVRDTDGDTIPPTSCCFRFIVGLPGGATSPGPATPPRSGYWMLGTDGRVYPFGDATRAGDAINHMLGPDAPTAVDLEPVPAGNGYWILDSAGHVFGFNAPYHGGVDRRALQAGETVTSLSATPGGGGYWIFTTAGRVFAFGDAVHYGDMGGIRLNGPVLDSIATPTGRGYYMVAADGGIFSFGDARFFGAMGGARLNAAVQSLVPDPDGAGYWLVASDGGVFSFEATFRGSMGSVPLNRPVTGMVPFGNGYLMVAEDGGIFNFSDRAFHGSLGANPPRHPVVAVAAIPS